MVQVGTRIEFSYKGREELLEFPYDTLFYLLRTLTTASSTVWPQIMTRGFQCTRITYTGIKKNCTSFRILILVV